LISTESDTKSAQSSENRRKFKKLSISYNKELGDV
jgi:hypothetical protein